MATAESRPAQKGINRIVAAGVLAGAVGLAAFGGYELTQNNSNVPESTPIAGGIGNPSPSEKPTITISPTETPSVTQTPKTEVTPSPEATPKPSPIVKAVEGIIDVPVQKTSMKQIKSNTAKLYENNAKADALYPQQQANTTLSWCEKGTPEDAGNANQIQASRVANCTVVLGKNYEVYKATGDLNALKIAQEAYWYGVSQYGDDFKNYADPVIKNIDNP